MSPDLEATVEQNEEIAVADRRREERRPVEEAGDRVSGGFELAEQDLVADAEDADEQFTARILEHAGNLNEEQSEAEDGEADAERVRDGGARAMGTVAEGTRVGATPSPTHSAIGRPIRSNSSWSRCDHG